MPRVKRQLIRTQDFLSKLFGNSADVRHIKNVSDVLIASKLKHRNFAPVTFEPETIGP